MALSANEFTAIGWVVVPILTAIATFFQQRRNDESNEKKALLREKEKSYIDLLVELENSSIEFWLNKGSSKKAIRMAVQIKKNLKVLDSTLPSHPIEIIKLRREITGSDFESPERKELDPTHEKFHLISSLIESFKNDKDKIEQYIEKI